MCNRNENWRRLICKITIYLAETIAKSRRLLRNWPLYTVGSITVYGAYKVLKIEFC